MSSKSAADVRWELAHPFPTDLELLQRSGDDDDDATSGVARAPPVSGSAWRCRSCCLIQGDHYRYPSTPWDYCSTCAAALELDEQQLTLQRLLLERPAPTPQTGALPPAESSSCPAAATEFLSIPEAAALLRRSVKSTYRLAVSGQLPGADKVGSRWRVRRADLLAFRPVGRVPPTRRR